MGMCYVISPSGMAVANEHGRLAQRATQTVSPKVAVGLAHGSNACATRSHPDLRRSGCPMGIPAGVHEWWTRRGTSRLNGTIPRAVQQRGCTALLLRASKSNSHNHSSAASHLAPALQRQRAIAQRQPTGAFAAKRWRGSLWAGFAIMPGDWPRINWAGGIRRRVIAADVPSRMEIRCHCTALSRLTVQREAAKEAEVSLER
jgi:hypothetical protein